MSARVAQALVFATSGLVLVLEIIAARLVAPYVGISLESFTAVIGTMLAGIAAGAALGGRVADRTDPARLIGPTIIAAGVLSWLSVPIVRALGPAVDASATSTVVLVASAFLLPSAVASSVSPMVAKLALGSIDETGTIVGGLSAAGTAGALAGTFLTGFVLVTVLSVRAIVFLIGAALVAIGVGVGWWLGRGRPTIPGAAAALIALAAFFGTASFCDHETEYYCVRIEQPAGEPRQRSLWLDQLRHGFVDLDDPTHHDIRYVRLLAGVVDAMPSGPIEALHVGGAAFAVPRHVATTRPGSDQLVLEIDGELVDIAERELGLVLDDRLRVRVGDARLGFGDLPDDGYDLIVGDAFGSEAVPWHLTTVEVAAELDRLLRDDGVYAVNLIDGPDARFVAAQLATLSEHFDHVAVIDPPSTRESGGLFNRVVLASDRPLAEPEIGAIDGRYVEGDPWGDGRVLTDDFAPVDQLMG